MLTIRNKQDAMLKIEKLDENKKELESKVKVLQQNIEELEIKVGLGTDKFIEASASDLYELENLYDTIGLYEEQIKKIDKAIEKLVKKFVVKTKNR